METIINYKVKDFLKLTDVGVVQEYIAILDLLKPSYEVDNPNYKWYDKWLKKHPKMLLVKDIRSLLYYEVDQIRNNFEEGSAQAIFDSIKLVLDVQDKEILNFTITTFYAIISKIRTNLIEVNNGEVNELLDDYQDEFLLAINANQRMAKFGVLNIIDSLANGDVLKWKEIEKLPYMVVFTKLRMENEKNKIQREINELQRKKQLKK
jgi:hypothetical protein